MIDHRAAETLMAVAIDFALTPRERADLDAHLAGCDRCRAIGAQLRRDALALRHGPSEDAPSEIRMAVEAAAAAAVPIDLRTRRYLFLVAAALLMALAVGGAIVAGSGLLDLDGLSVNPSPPLASPAASESSVPGLESSPTPALLGFPANTLIAFQVSDQVSSFIHTVEPNGANDRTLAEGSQAAWAPDGGSIAYACPAADDTVDICLLGADGSGQAILIENADRPQFAPDGGRLLFGDGSGDTWVANADGSQPVRVANGQGTWSPDGSWIMLETIGPLPNVSVVRPDGSGLRQLGVGRSPTWSPDSRRIGFSWFVSTDGGSVRAFDVETGSVETLLTPDPPVDQVAWVADNLIVGSSGDDLYLFNLATGDRLRLTTGISIQSVLEPSPDGQWIAFNAVELGAPEGANLDIYIAPISGAGATRVATGDSAVWQPSVPSVTFRLTVTGSVPADAAFAIQDGVLGGGQHAVYLCSYYGGYPACETGRAYDDVWTGAPGSLLSYRIWRELDANGASEEVEAGEVTADTSDQIVSVGYDFSP